MQAFILDNYYLAHSSLCHSVLEPFYSCFVLSCPRELCLFKKKRLLLPCHIIAANLWLISKHCGSQSNVDSLCLWLVPLGMSVSSFACSRLCYRLCIRISIVSNNSSFFHQNYSLTIWAENYSILPLVTCTGDWGSFWWNFIIKGNKLVFTWQN